MPDAESPLAQLRSLLAAHGDIADVAALVGEARSEARARVRSLLVDAFTEELLARVQTELRPAPRTPAPPPDPPRTAAPAAEAPPPAAPSHEAPRLAAPTADEQPDELGWYVYCIADGDLAPLAADLPGVAPRLPAFAMRHGDLTAVVSRVALSEFGETPLRDHLADLDWLERTARAHEHVLETVAQATTPIPMRLCTIYRDQDGVRDMLEREHDALRHALAHLAGKEEWGVKGFGDPSALPSDEPDADTETGSGQGAAYMQRRLTERRRRDESQGRLDQTCAQVHESLSAVALDAVVSAPHRPEITGRRLPMIMNASYLVATGERAAFGRAFDELRETAASAGVELELTGPWPPYNFVPGAIGAAW